MKFVQTRADENRRIYLTKPRRQTESLSSTQYRASSMALLELSRTTHGWTIRRFRGMRQSLTRSFEQIYVLDLHGSSKPKELAPNGVENKNVFDIQKGVAITILVKNDQCAARNLVRRDLG